MGENNVLILGAGLTGLSTAYFLKQKGVKHKIFEKETTPGGLCRSFKDKGFVFDFSGHLLHFRNKRTLRLVTKILNNNLARHKRNSYVYAFKRIIPYPFQGSLKYLPEKQARQCLSGLAKSNSQRSKKSNNFLQWIHNTFGKGIAEHFLIPYNSKLWRVPLDELDCSWAERFVITPVTSAGKIHPAPEKTRLSPGYNDFFWYPEKGAIEELIKGFTRDTDNISLNSCASAIDLKKRTVVFRNGKIEKFTKLISTLPLPELSRIVKPLPADIKKSFKKLKWVSIYNVNLGVKTRNNPPRHWIYFSQRSIPFFRVGFFHSFSSCLTPGNRGALYADVSYSMERPIRKKEIRDRVIRHLNVTGVLSKGGKDVCCEHINDIKYGYPVYDKNYKSARGKILKFLAKNNVISCGRYGGWSYSSMEDVILEAEGITEGMR